MFLHSGYAEHPRKRPNLENLYVIAEPHFSHVSSVSSASSSTTEPSSLRVKLEVKRHSGKDGHAANSPLRPHLMTSVLPHFGHGSSVSRTSRLTSRISSLARSRSARNGL